MKYSTFVGRAMLLLAGTAVVLAMMSSFFGRARENARRSSCASNLKQVGLGIKQYMQDYADSYPLATIYGLNAPKKPYIYQGKVTGYDYTKTPIGWADGLQPYLKSVCIYQCPSETNPPGSGCSPKEKGYVDYWYNSKLSGASDLKTPEKVIMVVDGDGAENSNALYSKSGFPADWQSPQSKSNWLRRHLGGANYLFADGHVQLFTPDAIMGGGGTFAIK